MTTDAATMQHMDQPQVGDVFHETYSFRVQVLSVADHVVTVRESWSDGTSRVRAFEPLTAFRAAYSYQSIPGYWVRYRDHQGEDGHTHAG